MTLTFESYVVEDDGIRLRFFEVIDEAGHSAYHFISLTNAELGSVTSAAQLRTLVTTKLKRKLLADGIASKLDSFIGQGVTI